LFFSNLETLNRIVFLVFLMSLDLSLLKSFLSAQKQPLKCTLHLNNRKYEIDNVTVSHLPTPVNSPTTRGGVYFSDKFEYKVKGVVHDLSIIPFLSKTMLGPNTDFGEIRIDTQLEIDGAQQDISLFTNLTNSVQTSSKIELNMILVDIKSK